MKMKLKENLLVKVIAFLLAAAAFGAAAGMAWYQAANIEVIWGETTPADGHAVYRLEWQDACDVSHLLYMYNTEARGMKLEVWQTQEKAALESALSAENTNLHWQVRDGEGNVRYGNTQEEIPVPATGLYQDNFLWKTTDLSVEQYTGDWYMEVQEAVNVTDPDNVILVGTEESWEQLLQMAVERYSDAGGTLTGEELDAVYLAPDGTTDLLVITDSTGRHVYGPSVRAVLEANAYGFQYAANGSWYQAQGGGMLDVFLWLDEGFPVADQYQRVCGTLETWQSHRGLLLAVNIACVAAGVLLAAWLCAAMGHKRGVKGISLHWFHRIPGDLLLALALGVLLSAGSLGVYLLDGLSYPDMPVWVIGAAGAGAAVAVLGLLLTLAARCKSHTVWRNTLIWRICRLLYRLGRGVAAALPLIWKTALGGAAYLVLSIYLWLRFFRYYRFEWIFLWLLLTVALLALLCLWAYQWKRIRRGTREIIGGNPDARIDARHMLPDLKSHAGELNNLGRAISAAVDERMKSERFKAELITNVSHDLKTPLTSIINYVDLLKKEDIDNPTAREYIDVLERKSQRLKKLTEDLVEASKASTGALTVNRERLNVVQLMEQAAGEYAERLNAAGLTLLTDLPETPLIVQADGRHLWRVLDNLLGNCAKYALEGTRVYLDAAAADGNAVITVKNISRQPLNIPAERLIERFVRGDESRTAEGSGLGLSIARSLTELQGGQFSLDIDGDLFKATVVFPLAQ